MNVLGIETSCDETAASIVLDGHSVKSNVIASQISQHSAFGGVVPELAAREHVRAITTVVTQALGQAEVDYASLDGIAVTFTPGLLPALLVGLSYAKGLSAALGIPLKGINHFLAHIFGAFIEREDLLRKDEAFPIIALVVSGGHTALTLIDKQGRCRIVGRTLDDAAGEAFDKAAKILHLSYPGGPLIDKLSTHGNSERYCFPQGLTGGNGTPVSEENRLNFSFSGVKTALLYHVKKHQLNSSMSMISKNTNIPIAKKIEDKSFKKCSASMDNNTSHKIGQIGSDNWDLFDGDSEFNQDTLDTIASYQEAVVDALVKKSIWAVEKYQAQTLVLCGGVACNSRLRHKLQIAADTHAVPLLIARPEYCTDNAAMIAGLGHYYFQNKDFDLLNLDAKPRLQEFTSVPFTNNLF